MTSLNAAPPRPVAATSSTSASSSSSSSSSATLFPTDAASGFGGKHIGLWGSVCLLANNVTGPAMIQIPVMYQTAGWLVPTIVFAFIGLQAGFAGLFLSKAVSQVPGNRGLRERMEFSNLAKLLFSRWFYLLVLAGLIFNFQLSNVVSIVESGQAMDNTLLAAAGQTCGLVMWDPSPDDGDGVSGNSTLAYAPAAAPLYSVSPSASASSTQFLPGASPFSLLARLAAVAAQEGTPTGSVWRCVQSQGQGSDSPFGDAYVVSGGFLIVMCVTIPLGYLNLEDNIYVQVAGFLGLVACIIVWSVQFVFVSGLKPAFLPAVYGQGMGVVIPTVAFNWAFITTMPSWLNEKGPGVSVSRATWIAILIGFVMFVLLGILGGLAIDFTSGEDLLAALNDPDTPNVMPISRIMTYIFAPCSLLTGIPVYSIIIRYNLLENKIMSKLWANLFAVVLPWVIALAFYPGNKLGPLIQWSSALLFVALNFLLPLLIYRAVNTEAGRAHLVVRMREEGMLGEALESERAEEGKLDGGDGAAAATAGTFEAAVTSPRRRGEVEAAGSSGWAAFGAQPFGALSRMLRITARRDESGELDTQLLSDVGGSGSVGSSAAAAGGGRVGSVSFSALPSTLRAVTPGGGGGTRSAAAAVNSSAAPSPLDLYMQRDGDEATADDFDWGGARDIQVLPRLWCNCCGEQTLERSAAFWLYSGAVLFVSCLLLQVLSEADPNDFAGA